MVYLFEIPYPNYPIAHHSAGLPLPCQGVLDGIVHLRQPNVATAWKLPFVQDKRQRVVSHLHFQSFSVKVKPCYRSAASASVFVRPAYADINTHRHGLESVLSHGLSDGLQCVVLHAVKDSPDGLGRGCSCHHKLSDSEKHSFKRNRRYSASSLPRSTASSMTRPSSSKYTSSPMHSVPA